LKPQACPNCKAVEQRTAEHLAALDAKSTELRGRWQRMLRAYLAFRELKTWDGSRARAPVLGRFLAALEELQPDDLKVLK